MKNVVAPKAHENTNERIIPLSLYMLARCCITEYSLGLLFMRQRAT